MIPPERQREIEREVREQLNAEDLYRRQCRELMESAIPPPVAPSTQGRTRQSSGWGLAKVLSFTVVACAALLLVGNALDSGSKRTSADSRNLQDQLRRHARRSPMKFQLRSLLGVRLLKCSLAR